MDMELTEQQQMIRNMVAEFAARELAPIAKTIDTEHHIPPEIIKKAADLNLLGLAVPAEYGGAGVDTISFGLALGELCRICGGTALSIAAHCMLATNHINLAGNEEQKQKYLVPLAKGEKFGAWSLTEPGAGSDALSQKTKAVCDPETGEWIINGQKCFCTNGGEADVIVVIAVTDRRMFHKGISAFIVEKDTPGFSVGKFEEKVCVRGSNTAELFFEDCRVPPENLLGREGYGIFTALECLDTERIIASAMLTAGAEQALNYSLEYAQERKQFGQQIVNFQSVYSMLAEMATEVEASRHLWYKAALRRDEALAAFKERGERISYSTEAAMAKLFSSKIANKVTSKAIQIHGGAGLTMDFNVERLWRDARLGTIGGGTSEIQKLVIARGLGIDILPYG